MVRESVMVGAHLRRVEKGSWWMYQCEGSCLSRQAITHLCAVKQPIKVTRFGNASSTYVPEIKEALEHLRKTHAEGLVPLKK